MKKEDLTTRLLRNLFHIQGPFDECRQEIVYKACARSMIQIFYSSFIHSLPILYFVRKLYRNCSKCYALHLFWTHFVHEYKSSKSRPRASSGKR